MIEYENLKVGENYLFYMCTETGGEYFTWKKRGQLIEKKEGYCIVRLIPLGILEQTEKKDIDRIFELDLYEV